MEASLTRSLAFVALSLAALLFLAIPARAQLLGLEHYLALPKVEYNADVSMDGDGDLVQGKVMRAHAKERREVMVEGDMEIMIIRLDRKLVWSLAPDEQLYVESPLDEALGRAPGPDGKPREPRLTVTPLGSEILEGLRVTRQKITGQDADGGPIDGMVWISEHGIVMRAESNVVDEDGKHHLVRMELHHLHLGPQDPKLFEIPAGYRRVAPTRLSALGSLIG